MLLSGPNFLTSRRAALNVTVCRLGHQFQPASFSHCILQIHLAAMSPPLQQHVTELEVMEEAGAWWERGHAEGREGLVLWGVSGEQARWREGLVRLGGGQRITCGC